MDKKPDISSVFSTLLYRAELGERSRINDELMACCLAAAEDDAAGRRWSKKHGYPGYTSYASLNDLPWRFPAFASLSKILDGHAKAFGRALEWDLQGKQLVLDSLWINVLDPGGFHSGHIHPLSVLSGTYYLGMPKGARAIRFEDPRLPLMMAAPPRKAKAQGTGQNFASVPAKAGTLLIWESWLRHEVPMNQANERRISVSFNYAWR